MNDGSVIVEVKPSCLKFITLFFVKFSHQF